MATEKPDLEITPETRVGKLLDAHPDLEQVLIDAVPAFAKLRSPILRRTVAKVTSLRQAAAVGGIGVADLVNLLRNAAGQGALELSEAGVGPISSPRPEWCREAAIAETIDIRPLLDSGQQPLGMIMSRLRDLPEGKVLKVLAPFLPAPLIDQAKKEGAEVWHGSGAEGVREVFIRRI